MTVLVPHKQYGPSGLRGSRRGDARAASKAGSAVRRAGRTRRTRTPEASVLALHLLSAILKRAAVRGLIPANPVDMVAKPSPPPAAPPRPLTPLTIEKIRAVMLKPKTKTVPASAPDKRLRRAYEAHTGSPTERQRNALIVSMLAYGGFRPIEDRNAEWRDVHKDAMRVYATKTRRERYVDLLAPLAEDLAEWRVACKGGTDGLIIPRPSGGSWSREDWANWRRRVYQPAALAAGVTGDLRPYRLRGSFVSLLLWSGEDLVYVADQAGHSVATLARHYAGVIRELRDVPKVPAAELIKAAREEVTATNGTHRGRTY